MRNFTRIAVSFFLVVTICIIVIVTRTRPAAVATAPQPQKDDRRDKLQRLKTQEFRGEAASLRTRQLRKLRKGVARAMKDAEKRGLRQAFKHGRVILATDPAEANQTAGVANSRFVPKAGLARPLSFRSKSYQDTFSEGDYEITFIPYDDGDPNTWEGIIYRYNPDYGDDTRYAVIDIHTDEPNVTEEIYYPSDGGDPQPLDPGDPALIIAKSSDGVQPRGCLAKALTPRYRETKLTEWAGMRLPCPPGWRPCLRLRDECCSPPPNLVPWLKCTVKGCAGGAAGCGATGPAFGECWGAICVGSMLFCLV